MPAINKDCSVFNGFNFKRDVQDKIGHATQLTIGEKTLTADLTVKEPIEEGDEKVVGVISSFSWDGGYAQPIQFSMQISITNKNEIASLLHTQMKSVAVTVNFNIYEYDPEAKAYYKSLHTNDADIKGLIQVEGDERILYLSDEPGMEVQQPINYQIVIGIVPEDEQQEIHLAVSQSMKFVKPWGVTRG